MPVSVQCNLKAADVHRHPELSQESLDFLMLLYMVDNKIHKFFSVPALILTLLNFLLTQYLIVMILLLASRKSQLVWIPFFIPSHVTSLLQSSIISQEIFLLVVFFFLDCTTF